MTIRVKASYGRLDRASQSPSDECAVVVVYDDKSCVIDRSDIPASSWTHDEPVEITGSFAYKGGWTVALVDTARNIVVIVHNKERSN